MTSTLNPDGHTIKFEIWDTAGQERFHSLAPMYYRGSHAAIIVYDISSEVGKNYDKSNANPTYVYFMLAPYLGAGQVRFNANLSYLP